jgi:Flp pilus assembly CpaF family ATPase
MSSLSEDQPKQDLVKQMRIKVWDRLGGAPMEGSQEERTARLEQLFAEVLAEEGISIPDSKERKRLRFLVTSVNPGWSDCMLQLVEDDAIQDIVVIGPNRAIFRRVDREDFENTYGKCFDDEDHMLRYINLILAPQGHRLNIETPFAAIQMPDGSQVQALLDTLGTKRPVLIIHKGPRPPKVERPHLNLLKKKDIPSKG